MELIEKLNKKQNFHLAIRSILITNECENIKKYLVNNHKTTYVLDNNKDYYEQLKFVYDNKIDYLIYDGKLDILNPLMVIILDGNFNLVYPYIDTYYMTKDNRIENNIIKQARKRNSNFYKIRKIEEVFDKII